MTPWKSPSVPHGQLHDERVRRRRRSSIISTVRSKSAPVRSILLTKQMRGTWYRSAWRQTVSVCGSTPATASNTATAPSSTRSDRSTSTVKSTWPGVSMMLIQWPFHWHVVAADGDRDAALALLDHPVHLGGALVDLADLVGLAGVVEDALGRGGLARVDVGHDPDVARASERVLADHESLPAPLDVLFGRLPRASSPRGSAISDPLVIGRPRRPGRELLVASPSVVRERLVGLGHLVHVLAALDRRPCPFDASMISPTRRSAIECSRRCRE